MKPQGWTPDRFLFPTLPLINGCWEQCKREGFNLSYFALSVKTKLIVLTAKLEPLCKQWVNKRQTMLPFYKWKKPMFSLQVMETAGDRALGFPGMF